ncbi:hypothetical protein T4B_1910 [Trichinella pseudospiralis]|uniref:Uncharacterized protein n=1 Tax=Trichinella pseudospiralis TaxID=6337 RepID=A0A0V1GUJ7_TRIPS|nr:hypothetical protein T4B_275 [Trichinella pseudospiralis]KRZ13127.1 hypothetical protein T4B_1910 [Trichinella pseudospiralis]
MTAELSARFRTIEVIHLKEDCVVERSRLPTIRLIPAHQHVFLLSYRYRNSDVINTFVRVFFVHLLKCQAFNRLKKPLPRIKYLQS